MSRSEPRNRAERRQAMRKAGSVAGRALTAGSAALGTTAALIAGTAGPAAAATFEVNDPGDAGDNVCDATCTLRDAIDDSNASVGTTDDITFAAGALPTITLDSGNGQLAISDSVNILGPGAAALTVDGVNSTRIFYVFDGATQLTVNISGITLANGATTSSGGAIVNWGEILHLTDTVISGSEAAIDGGGIAAYYSNGGTPQTTIDGASRLENNQALYNGGGVHNGAGTLTITGTTVLYDNTADVSGGGVFQDFGDLSITGSVTFDRNDAGNEGGGAHVDETTGDTTISGATFTGNTAGNEGGGVYLYDPSGTTSFLSTTITGNEAAEGGGIGSRYSEGLRIEGSQITGNTADDGDGGGVALYSLFYGSPGSALTILSSNVSGNDADSDGGGLYLRSSDVPVVIHDSTFSENTALADGGGIALYEVADSLDVANVTISGNDSADFGGGLYLYDTDDDVDRTIRNTTISGNTASNAGGGFALYANENQVSFFNSTISGNAAGDGGAGLASLDQLYLVQATVTANVAVGGTTGGILFPGAGALSVLSGEKAERAAEQQAHVAEAAADRAAAGAPGAPGGGTGKALGEDRPLAGAKAQGDGPTAAAVDDYDNKLVGTIVSGNSGFDIGGGTPGNYDTVSSRASLFGSLDPNTPITDLGGTIVNSLPLLGPLASNGGPTQTHALLRGSPAIDNGPDPALVFPGSGFDQRGPGFARIINGRVDIGAFEAPLRTIDFTG